MSTLREIGELGDSQWRQRLSDSDAGAYVRLKDGPPPYWSIVYRVYRWAESQPDSPDRYGVLVVAAVFLVWIDVVVGLIRVALLPLLLLAWWCERGLARLLGRTFLCPLCHNPMRDPYVFCSSCRRVQGQLRPTVNSLFIYCCARCGETRWPVLGNYLGGSPRPLVCRDTRGHRGCYYPHPLTGLAGTSAARHVAIVGPALASKHAFLGHLVAQVVSGGDRGYRPANTLAGLEFDLMKQRFMNALQGDTADCEQPGKRYSLARTLVLQAPRRALFVLHNLCNSWLADEERLFTDGISWSDISSLVFVVDGAVSRANGGEGAMSHAEVYSRVVRVVEKDLRLNPGTLLPFQVAVVLPFPPHAFPVQGSGVSGRLAEADAEAHLWREAPAFCAMLRRTMAPHKLRFFGGVLDSKLDLLRGRWLQEVADWILAGRTRS